jgi:hypothetical protein
MMKSLKPLSIAIPSSWPADVRLQAAYEPLELDVLEVAALVEPPPPELEEELEELEPEPEPDDAPALSFEPDDPESFDPESFDPDPDDSPAGFARESVR